jgi:hypothetical protein
MEGSQVFLARLEEAVERRRVFLDADRLPSLKEAFHALQTHLESLFNMLIKKGLLREDPYKYDQKVADLALPEDTAFTESEQNDELSYRLSAYRSQLDHLNSYSQFSVSSLDLAQLKKLSLMLGYIQWKSLTDTSKSPTTRALAERMIKVRTGADTMASGIVKDAVLQIDKVMNHINLVLGELASLHREAYKCELRAKVMPDAQIDAHAAAKKDDALRSIKRTFSRALPGRLYYPELVDEIIEEDFGEDAEERRAKLFDSLSVVEQRKEGDRKPEKISYKEILLEAVHILAHTAFDISSAIDTLADNHMVLTGRRLTMGERLRRLVTRGLRRKEEEYAYQIEYTEGTDPALKTEKVSFLPFIEAGRKKAGFLNSLANRTGASYQKLEAAREDQVLDFVSKQLADFQLLYRRMSGLNAFFPGEIAHSERQKLKGIKLQLTVMKNAMGKTNQKKHEYVGRKEEEEQLKRLGIR